MRRAKTLVKWVGRKYTSSLVPAFADYWYACRFHGNICSCLGSGRSKNKEEEEEEEVNAEAATLEYQGKIPEKWSQKDVVSFVCQEVTMGDVKEFRICRLCTENEVDGTALLAASDTDLLELGFDPVSVRKLRGKLESLGHDNSAEQRVVENDLGHLRDRLMNELGVFSRDELPTLIADKKWVKTIGLKIADEIKLKSAIRQYAQGLVTEETSKRLGSVGHLSGNKKKSISLRKKSSAEDGLNARQNVYNVVKQTGLDKVDFRSKGRPKWLMDVKVGSGHAKPTRRVGLVVTTPVKWNSDTVFTPPNLSAVVKEGGAATDKTVTQSKSTKFLRNGTIQEVTLGDFPTKTRKGLPPGYGVQEALSIISPRPRGYVSK
eukprot:CAMPEP_0173063520 /NCGR_PEP_ID=MMETSP1102-20130122/4436_1 /TAXON_ID=49646 /ORGANISM="Geminigera sp., Strain Caron Lab Isolate" /LENGTH=375 /DNA_ID=CAMNT_0013930345 /DNA_START=426 /DNA_END=1554 /DNA_ORIENTATION=+